MAVNSDLAPVVSSPWSALSGLSSQVSEHVVEWGHAFVAWYRQAGQAIARGVVDFSAAIASAVLWQSVLYGVLVLVMLVGVAGAFIPALPGISLVLGAVVVWGFVKGFAGLWVALGVAIAALILSVVIDYLSGIIGAQRVGASNWGQIGAIIGMVLGLFGLLPALPIGGPLVGIILGTVLGAFVGEFLHRRELAFPQRTQQSLKVGLAIVVGNLVGNLLQGVLAFISVVVFVVTTWSTVYGG